MKWALLPLLAISAVISSSANDECRRSGQLSVAFHGSVAEGIQSSTSIWNTFTGGMSTVYYVSLSDLMGAGEDQIKTLLEYEKKSFQQTPVFFELGLDLAPLGEDINDLNDDQLIQLVRSAEERLHKLQYVRLPWRSFSMRVLQLFQDRLGLTITESSNDSDGELNRESLVETFQLHGNSSIYLILDAGRLLSLDGDDRQALQTFLDGQITANRLSQVSVQACLNGWDLMSLYRTGKKLLLDPTLFRSLTQQQTTLVYSMILSLSVGLSLIGGVVGLFRAKKIKQQ